jgi:hypothetical protein
MPTGPRPCPALHRRFAFLGVVVAASGCGGAPAHPTTSVSLDAPAGAALGQASTTTEEVVEPRVPARNSADAPGAVAFVETLGDRTWIVVDEATDDQRGTVPTRLSMAEDAVTVMEAKARVSSLPPAARLGGRSFDLYREDEKLCTVKAGAMRVLGLMYTPHEQMADGDGDGKTTDEELWSLTGRHLALPADVPEACRKATWARLAELPEPRFARVMRSAPAMIAGKTEVEFRASTLWAEAQASYAEAGTRMGSVPAGTWEDVATVTELTWALPSDAASWTVRQAVWDEGCGATAALTMVWRSSSTQGAVVFTGAERFEPAVVLDVDGDGTLEMIGSSFGGVELRRFFGAGDEESLRRFHMQDHGCGC